MASVSTRMEVLKLYKAMLRESSKFSSYNYRNYAVRRIKDAFRENKSLAEEERVKQQLQEGYRNLEVIKRQALLGSLYDSPQLVIELPRQKTLGF